MSRENFNSTIHLILCIVFQINCVLPFVSSNSINISDTCLKKVPDERKHLNSTVDADAQHKKSLIFVFDTTGSMKDELPHLKIGTEKIVQDFSLQSENILFTYGLVAFNDPGIGTPFITEDQSDFLQKLNKVDVVSSFNLDFPEPSLAALKSAIRVALPNSLIFLFTDAPAKDSSLYDDIKNLILEKQLTVNILLLGKPRDGYFEGYDVYRKIGGVNNGQFVESNGNNLLDAFAIIRGNFNPNYAIIKAIDSPKSDKTVEDFYIDKSITEFKVLFFGTKRSITIKDPELNTINASINLQMDTGESLIYENPVSGTWKIEVYANKNYKVIISALNNLKFEVGFSVDTIDYKSQTSNLPISGYKNVISIFTPGILKVKQVSFITIVDIPSDRSQISKRTEIPAIRRKDDLYFTDPIDIPKNSFLIWLKGKDSNNKVIERLISSEIVAVPGSAPEVSITSENSSIFWNGNLNLECEVTSFVPVKVAWIFEGNILESIQMIQSNSLKLAINNVTFAYSGKYKCVAENFAGCRTKTIDINVLDIPRLTITNTPKEIIADSEVSLHCLLYEAHLYPVHYTWFDDSGNILQKGGDTYTFTPTVQDNKRKIKCETIGKGFKTEQTKILNINHAPIFLSEDTSSYLHAFGSNVNFNCSVDSNPPNNPVKWFITKKETGKPQLISGKTGNILDLPEVFEKDEGEYECIVSNKIGEAKRQFNIELSPKDSPKPSLINKPIITNALANIELFCECSDCLPITNYSWIFENKKDYEYHVVKDEKLNYFKSFVKIDNAAVSDGGKFYCQISNILGKKETILDLKIQVAPKVDKILNKNYPQKEVRKAFEIDEGSDGIFECIAFGVPESKIYWLQKGEKISDDVVLNIKNVTSLDDGIIECVAENTVGGASKKFQLNVNFKPTKGDQYEQVIEAVEGQEVFIECNLTGRPALRISWSFNSKRILANKKYSIVGNTLSFTSDSDDSGTYKCTGDNIFGSKSLEFPVIITGVPKFFSPNDETIKIENNTLLSLSCDAMGYPRPIIKIKKNNIVIANSSSYQILAVRPSDAGTYHCYAENDIGTAEKIFYVAIVKSPTIITYFKDISLKVDEEKELSCLATGIPQPTIKWKFNDAAVISTSDTIILNSSLSSGKISCIAENSEGNDERSFNLDLSTMPILLSIAKYFKTNISIREGDDLELLCPFENFDNITWSINESVLNVSNYKQIDRKLIIFDIRKQHEGRWKCNASNIKGSVDFSYNITVNFSPTVLASWNFNNSIIDFDQNEANMDKKLFSKGENLLLNCTFSGSPSPIVEWRKGADLIERGEILKIDNIQSHHSDFYSCSAKNNLGTIQKYFKIDVLSPPYIIGSLSSDRHQESKMNETAILKCGSIVGNPEPLFIWFKENDMLENETQENLIIDNVQLSDEGNYRCMGKNKFGFEKINFYLEVNEPAEILQVSEKEMTDKKIHSVELSCIVKGSPLSVVSWKFNGHTLVTTAEVDMTEISKKFYSKVVYFNEHDNSIKYIDPKTLNSSSNNYFSKLTKINSKTLKLDLMVKNTWNYVHMNSFNCYALNALGRDEKSIDITIRKKPFIAQKNVPKQLRFEIFENMPAKMSCLVEGYPKPNITWLKDGVELKNNETNKFINDNKILSIAETSLWDSGSYSCIAANNEGTLELKFEILVKSPPKIVSSSRKSAETQVFFENFESIDVKRGDNVTLECIVEASPKAKIHWVELDLDGDSKLLKEKSSFLTLISVQESFGYMCYANNSVGYAQKVFHLNIEFAPEFISGDDRDQNLTVKLHHSFALNCKTNAYPEATTYWSFDSTNITNSDSQVLQINNANSKHRGRFTCISFNSIGQVQKSFNVNIEIPIKFFPWGKWSECSEFCGTNGTQYRKRKCILLDNPPSYNCSGQDTELRKCNEFPCPVNGDWSDWSDWSACPGCYDATDSVLPKQKRIRFCNNPAPAHGGFDCVGNDYEEQKCDSKICGIDGNWSDWSEWSNCTAICGKGHQYRVRICNNPEPKHGGKNCVGKPNDSRPCESNNCRSSETPVSFGNGYRASSIARNPNNDQKYYEAKQRPDEIRCRNGSRQRNVCK